METMSSVLALNPIYSQTDSQFVQDFWLKLKLMEEDKDDRQPVAQKDVALQTHQNEKAEQIGAIVDEKSDSERQDGEDFQEEEAEEEEFSFSSAFSEEPLISAEEAFLNGQIRPVFPLFDRDLLLSDEIDANPEGSYCEWSGKKPSNASTTSAVVVDASPDVCKKSNSTGFCKLRRFRELVLRSNSDGKDKFAFLNEASGSSKGKKKTEKVTKSSTSAAKKKEKETASSAFEKIYAQRKKEEKGKRLSYLPYKQVGFFASVNGLSKNVHPY